MVAWRKDKDKGTNTYIVQASVKASWRDRSKEWEQGVAIDKMRGKEKKNQTFMIDGTSQQRQTGS